MKIEITYKWPTIDRTSREIESVTIKSSHVPRMGEDVNLNIRVTTKESIIRFGVVKCVKWTVTRNGSRALVYLS